MVVSSTSQAGETLVPGYIYTPPNATEKQSRLATVLSKFQTTRKISSIATSRVTFTAYVPLGSVTRGNRAMPAAMRRASSRESSLAVVRLPGSSSK